MSSIGYFIREAFKGFRRNLSTTLGSIITSLLSLLIIGVFLVAGSMLGNIMATTESEVSITAYLSDEATEDEVEDVMDYIEGLDYVASVEYTSKDQALANFTATSSTNASYIEQLDGENPLPASIDVELTDPQQVSSVADAIASYGEFRDICDDPDDPASQVSYGQQTVERLFSLFNTVRYVGIALIVVLVFIALVFINNTIRLAILARRKEIAIMRLVGASNGFIRGPFLMEGALDTLIGALLSVAALEALRRFALPQLQQGLPFLPLEVPFETFLFIYIVLIVAGLVIGLIGSAFAMRRYLKV